MSEFNGSLPRDPQYLEKCDEYMKYIEGHRERVATAYKRLFENNLENILSEDDLANIEVFKEGLAKQIEVHDMSKYSDVEFEPYRVYRYPTDAESEAMANDTYLDQLAYENYEVALTHHRKVNSHHPYYYLWIGEDYYTVMEKPRESALDMPIVAVIEMICDWASFDPDCDYLKWYVTDDAEDVRIIMTENTRRLVEEITAKIIPEKWDEYRTKYSNIFLTTKEE